MSTESIVKKTCDACGKEYLHYPNWYAGKMDNTAWIVVKSAGKVFDYCSRECVIKAMEDE